MKIDINIINIILYVIIIIGVLTISYLVIEIIYAYKLHNLKYDRNLIFDKDCTFIIADSKLNKSVSVQLIFTKINDQPSDRIEPITKDSTLLGRDPKADICIKDMGVSRCHVTIIFRNNIVSVRDENSSNGTFINGERIEPLLLTKIQPDDIISIGETVFSIK